MRGTPEAPSVHILTKILVVLVALLACAIAPLAAVSSTNQAEYKKQAVDAQASLKAKEAEVGVANDAYNASVAALQAKASDLEARLRAATMESAKEQEMRADKERDLERVRIEIADLQGQLRAFSSNDTLQTQLIADRLAAPGHRGRPHAVPRRREGARRAAGLARPHAG